MNHYYTFIKVKKKEKNISNFIKRDLGPQNKKKKSFLAAQQV